VARSTFAINTSNFQHRNTPDFSGVSTRASTEPNLCYIAYPYTDDTADIAGIKKTLEENYKDQDVAWHQDSDGHVGWRVCLDSAQSIEDLRNLEGIALVLPENSPANSTRELKRSAGIEREEDKMYVVAAKDPNKDDETKKTREFLDSKMKDKNVYIYEFRVSGTNHILG
jgi:hypothetical protein